jgi:hypothetical protein
MTGRTPNLPEYNPWADRGKLIDTFERGGAPGTTWKAWVVRWWSCDYWHTMEAVVAYLSIMVQTRPISVRDNQPFTLQTGPTLTHLTRGELERVAQATPDECGKACIFLAQQRLSLHLEGTMFEAVRQAAQQALDWHPVPEVVQLKASKNQEVARDV